MSAWRQLYTVVILNLRNLPRRRGVSLVVVLGIAGVVGVLVSVLAMAIGFTRTIADAGSPQRALILSGGALQEAMSSIPASAIPHILDAAGIAKNVAGRPIADAEALAQVQIKAPGGGRTINVALRGVGPVEPQLRPALHLVAGRMFRRGLHEVIAGRTLAARYGLRIGSPVAFQNSAWTVVGVFASSAPNQLDSELMTDTQTLLAALKRNWFQSVTLRLAGPGALARLQHSLTMDPTLHVHAYRESAFAAAQSRYLDRILKWIGYIIGGMMAAGAVFGALNSLYAAVSTRSVEIATLRALGFGAAPVVISVLTEALLLSLAGGLVGAACAWTFFNGHIASLQMSGLEPPLVFAMAVTPGLVGLGVIWACVIGLLGGVFPALRAARLPIAKALNTVV